MVKNFSGKDTVSFHVQNLYVEKHTLFIIIDDAPIILIKEKCLVTIIMIASTNDNPAINDKNTFLKCVYYDLLNVNV